MNWSAVAHLFAQPLNARVTPPRMGGTSWRARQSRRTYGDYRYTTSATMQGFYRRLTRDNLPLGEWRVLKFFMERWWKHRPQGPALAYSATAIAKGIGYTTRQVARIMRVLTGRGFIVVAHGGVGRGNVRHCSVDFRAIREALAPDLTCQEKVTFGPRHIEQRTKVARHWLWRCGLWGRSDVFRGTFVRALMAEASATRRGMVGARPKHTPPASKMARHTGNQEAGMTWDELEAHWRAGL